MTAIFETYKQLTNSLVRRVNAQRGLDKRLREAIAPRSLRQGFVATARLAAERQLAAGVLAEASHRLSGDKLLITAAQSWFAQLSEADLTIAALNDGWQLTTANLPLRAEWHRAIYKNSAAKAIIFCQPVAATVVANQPVLWPQLADEAIEASVGGVAACPNDVAEIAKTAVHHRVLLIQGAGTLAWAETLAQAVAYTETVNRWCEIMLKWGKVPHLIKRVDLDEYFP